MPPSEVSSEILGREIGSLPPVKDADPRLLGTRVSPSWRRSIDWPVALVIAVGYELLTVLAPGLFASWQRESRLGVDAARWLRSSPSSSCSRSTCRGSWRSG